MVGPWGFEMIDESEEEGELTTGSRKKTKRVFNTGKPVVGIGTDAGRGGGGGGDGQKIGIGEGDDKGGRTLRQGMAGVRDGSGVFEISVKNENFCHGFSGDRSIDGVDDSEVQLFQPLQHAAHEER